MESGAAASTASSTWEGPETQVLGPDVMDELADKFRQANDKIDLEGDDMDSKAKEVALAHRLHTAVLNSMGVREGKGRQREREREIRWGSCVDMFSLDPECIKGLFVLGGNHLSRMGARLLAASSWRRRP